MINQQQYPTQCIHMAHMHAHACAHCLVSYKTCPHSVSYRVSRQLYAIANLLSQSTDYCNTNSLCRHTSTSPCMGTGAHFACFLLCTVQCCACGICSRECTVHMHTCSVGHERHTSFELSCTQTRTFKVCPHACSRSICSRDVV